MNQVPVLGIPVAATDYQGAVSWVLEKARLADQAYALEAANTHVLALARQDADFANSLNHFDLIVPDGMPLVWVINASHGAHQKLSERVYGPTLMLEVLKATNHSGEYRHFLLGGRHTTLTNLTKRFSQIFPNTSIAGSYSPPFGPWPDDELDRIIQKIKDCNANLIWVGLGCPKQEHWIARNKGLLPPGVYFGIGAAFAFHAGEVRQSPRFFQNLGLEWAYRLAMEPRRLFKRYLTYNSLFLYHLLKDRITD